mmetsp:Transcript_54931/g.132989  ORF Transcript_54931/g.132989 Transcript_54931/m.132989 type:complete len:291 (+) Transcript_54931:682-1554(+)
MGHLVSPASLSGRISHVASRSSCCSSSVMCWEACCRACLASLIPTLSECPIPRISAAVCSAHSAVIEPHLCPACAALTVIELKAASFSSRAVREMARRATTSAQHVTHPSIEAWLRCATSSRTCSMDLSSAATDSRSFSSRARASARARWEVAATSLRTSSERCEVFSPTTSLRSLRPGSRALADNSRSLAASNCCTESVHACLSSTALLSFRTPLARARHESYEEDVKPAAPIPVSFGPLGRQTGTAIAGRRTPWLPMRAGEERRETQRNAKSRHPHTWLQMLTVSLWI